MLGMRLVVFVIGLSPALWLGWQYHQGNLGPFPAEAMLHFSGHTGLILLLLTLAWGFLRRFTGQVAFVATRRQLGLWGFWWLIAHALFWLGGEQGWQWQWIWHELSSVYHLQLGVSILCLLSLLALTSPTRVRQAMPLKIWQWLHRSLYLCIALGILHYWIVIRLDYRLAWTYLAALVLLVLLRLIFLHPPTQKSSKRQTS